MCGICGVVEYDRARAVETATIAAMNDALAHRGPDDRGIFTAGNVGLGSRRLAILDLSPGGAMPMSTPDGRYVVAYNGEIYNFLELRAELEARGRRFRTRTDTEVLLSLYAELGPGMLPKLNGMFAFAIWDAAERRLFLARDRLGVKPLYLAISGTRLAFASEPKALFAAGVPRRLDDGALEELLLFRHVAGERSAFAGITRLLPGHALTWRDGRIETTRWWSLSERARALRETPLPSPEAWFRETFDDSVRLRRISDVPVGVLLSGGLDSSSVAAALALSGAAGAASFTVRFAESGYDEGDLAREVVDRYGLEPHELTLSGPEVVSALREVARLNDEPLAHGSDLHVFAISKFAKSRVTVLLSGEGGDELLGGYVRYRPLAHARALAALRPALGALAGRGRSRLDRLARLLGTGSADRWVLFDSAEVFPSELLALGMNVGAGLPYREELLREAAALYPGDLRRQAMFVDQHTYLCSLLDRNDRMTMGASIECRVPFLDFRLVEGTAALPSDVLFRGRGAKGLLRRALGDRLPRAVLAGRKWGFAVPWSTYMRRVPELRETVEALADLEPVRSGPLDRARVRAVARGFLAGDPAHEALVRQLTMLAIWHEENVSGGSADVRAASA